MVGGGSTFDENYPERWLSFGWNSTFSPYFELWESQREPVRELALGVPSPLLIPSLNAWLASVRTQAHSSPFHDLVARQERAARKNAASTKVFLHNHFRHRGRILAVRVDFGYRNDPFGFGDNWAPPPDAQVKEHVSQLIRFIQRKVEAVVGYIWKIEFGAAKGHHCHVLALLDGHKAREGITWGNLLGDNWLSVTKGAGTFWNCNADMESYARRGLLGIGMINYDDLDGRRNLMRTAMYLAKVDYYARFVSPDITRTFGKSVLKGEPSGRGRPRRHVSDVELAQCENVAPKDATTMAIERIRRGWQG